MKKFRYTAWMLIFAMTLAGCGAGDRTAAIDGQGRIYADVDSDENAGGESVTSDDNPGGESTDGENTPAGELVSCIGTDGSITLTIPEGWKYEITEKGDDGIHDGITYDGIRFWPEGKDGKIGLYYYDTGFGVCGTGLEEHEITLPGGQQGDMGTYDNGEVWDFIVFWPSDIGGDDSKLMGRYVAQTEGADEWWSEYESEAMEILGTAQLGADQTVAVADFGVRLFQECATGEDNCLISPVSVLEALAMTANGAEEETLKQMETVFGTTVPQMNPYYYRYNHSLPQGENYKLSIANSIWVKDDDKFEVNLNFLQANEKWYGAEVRQAPFDNNTLQDINQWVDTNTDGMIEKILDDISPEAVMYLVNAVAFEAEWQKLYEESDVRDGVFTLSDGTEQDVKLMYSTEHDYLQDENAQGFIKYYADKKYAFAALLPNEGVSVTDYIASLDGEKLHAMLENPVDVKVYAAIPEFESEYDVRMGGILSQMGMKDAFDMDRADFTGIGSYPGQNIYISNVIHKTYIAVDPKGTKAAAATAVEIRNTAAVLEPEEVKYVYLDRPFVYMLIDCETNTPVFIGVLNHVN